MRFLFFNILIILTSFLFSTCNSENRDSYYNRLEGDWISTNYENLFWTFKDSLILGECEEIFTPYFISRDTLFIPAYMSRIPVFRITDKYIWSIDYKTKDTIPFSYSTNVYFTKNILLNNLKIKFTGDGFRGLVDWSLYLDKNLNCFFKLEKYWNINRNRIPLALSYNEGSYFTNISKKEFNYILNKVQRIPFGQLKQNYFSERSYNHQRYVDTIIELEIEIGFKDSRELKTIQINSKGLQGLPATIGVLINYLHQIHFFVDFKPTDQKIPFN